MVFGDILASIGLAISAIVFVGLAFDSRSDKLAVEEYLLFSHTGTSREFGPSFAAASTSLATVIIFFLSTSQLYGPFLFWCGFTYFSGQALFLYLMKEAELKTSELSTNADYWLSFAQAPVSAFMIGLMTISSFVLILFVELYIGSVIVNYYFSDIGLLGKAISFLLLGAIVIAYVKLGGIKVVFKTDGWQLRLMVLSMLVFILFAVFSVPINDESENLSPQLLNFSASNVEIFLFCAWIAIINFTLPFTQLSSWQRVAAMKSPKEAWSGLLKTAPQFLLIWMLPVLALMVLNSKGYSLTSLPLLFDAMRSPGGAISGLLYPLLFVGFASALFSTADTAMIAVQLAVSDKSTFGSKLIAKKGSDLRRSLLWFTGLLVFCLAVLFGLAESKIDKWFMPIVFAIFSTLGVIAPQLLFGLIYAKKGIYKYKLSRFGDWANFLGILGGWLVIVVATVLRGIELLPQQGTQEVATYLAVFVSTIGLLIGITLSKKGKGNG
jgi:Na+/proline symporter